MSSNLISVGYEPTSQTLEVEFRRGGIYQYFAVPYDVYHRLINASAQGASVGQYFDRHVKKAGYRFLKA